MFGKRFPTMRKRSTPPDFWKHVERGRPQECWPWKMSCDEHGYGRVRYQRKEWPSHRLAWTLVNGDPGSLFVLHECDNPPCCNPLHLFPGTHQENMADSARKGRHPRNRTGYLPTGDDHHARARPEVLARGERNGAAVLSANGVRKIRRLRRSGIGRRTVARMFGVSKGTIWFIDRGVTWRHVE